MEENKKMCYRCKYFSRYFTMGVKRFIPTKLGWCLKKEQTVKSACNCPHYAAQKPIKVLKPCVKYRLNDLFNELSAIRQILDFNLNGVGDDEEV